MIILNSFKLLRVEMEKAFPYFKPFTDQSGSIACYYIYIHV